MSILPNQPGAKKLPGDQRSQAERATAICIRVANGKSLRRAARLEGMDHSRFLQLVAVDEPLRILYEQSRNTAVEERIVGIGEQADEVMRHAKKVGKAASSYVSAFATKARVAQWEAERLMPKKYGTTRIDMTVDANVRGSVSYVANMPARRRQEPPKE